VGKFLPDCRCTRTTGNGSLKESIGKKDFHKNSLQELIKQNNCLK
jgi:hypothetical protein